MAVCCDVDSQAATGLLVDECVTIAAAKCVTDSVIEGATAPLYIRSCTSQLLLDVTQIIYSDCACSEQSV